MGKRKKKNAKPVVSRTDTPVYDQLTADLGFAPHDPLPPGAGRLHPATTGLLEDNFS